MDTKQLKAKILDLAVHGKLLPLETLSELKNSPDYEPASKLLEKLRAEKEEKIAKGELKRDKKDSYIFVGDDNRHYEKFADGTVNEIEVPFKLPDNWSWMRLKSVCDLFNGDRGVNYPSKKDYVEKGIAFINAGCLDIGNIDYSVANYITEEKYNSLSGGKIEKYDILYCLRGSLGKTGIVNNDEKGAISSSLCIFRTKAPWNYKFLHTCLLSSVILNQQNTVDNGTAQPNLAAKDVVNYLLPISPLTEQKLIVEEIEKIFNLIDSLETDKSALLLAAKQAKAKILDLAIHGKLVPQDPADEPASVLLEKLRAEKEAKIAKGELKRDKNDSFIYKSTSDNCHYEKFSGKDAVCIEDEIPFELPEGWAWCRLGEISSKLKRGKSPKYTEKSSIMAFAQKCNQKDGPTTLEKALYIDESTLRKYPEEEKMQFNDIVINSTGTGTLGRVGIFDCNIPDDIAAVYPDSHVSSVRINSELFAKYFYYFVKSKQSYLETMGEGSTNQKELKIDTIANLIVSLPPISEQKRIVSKIEELFEALDQIQNNLV